MRSVSLEMSDRLETGFLYQVMHGFLRSGVTKECLNSRGNLLVYKKKLISLVIMGTMIDAQSFGKEVGILV